MHTDVPAHTGNTQKLNQGFAKIINVFACSQVDPQTQQIMKTPTCSYKMINLFSKYANKECPRTTKLSYICKEESSLCLFHLETFDLLLNPLVLLQLLLRGPLTVEV